MSETSYVFFLSRFPSPSHCRQITRGIHTDCLLNYETVKYFCGEEHEAARYRDALREYQTLEYTVMSAYDIKLSCMACLT